MLRTRIMIVALPALLHPLASCGGDDAAPGAPGAASDALTSSAAWRIATAPHAGTTDLDGKIRKLQDRLRSSRVRAPVLQNLGWHFVAKARRAYDPGFYKLAEKCADCIDLLAAGSASAMLLRGHVYQSLHRFAEAERIARDLVAERGEPFDHGLLGDVLLDRGDVAGATDAYQRMLDLKPCLQSYSRAGYVRWLRGDLDGARELMSLAVGAGSPRDPSALVWSYTRLASIELQAGRPDDAERAIESALRLVPDAAPALLAKSRLLAARGDAEAALEPLREAARRNPLPEYRWALADGLRATGRTQEAQRVEKALERLGAVDDPRTFALYLASRGKDPARAVALAHAEAKERADIYTQDAIAWALQANGEAAKAAPFMERALALGTKDARLWLHAGVIAAANGRTAKAREWLQEARAVAHMLLPLERRQLSKALASL